MRKIFITIFLFASFFNLSVFGDDGVLIKGGTVDCRRINASLKKNISVRDLTVNKYLVTKSDWDSFVTQTKKYDFYKLYLFGEDPITNFFRESNLAMFGMTFLEACEFCNWKSRQEGLSECYKISSSLNIQNRYYNENGAMDLPKIEYISTSNGYRLPTEDEWIYFSFGGLSGIKEKWWKKNPVESYAWTKMEWTSKPVGKLKANPYGLYDVFGNVWEWCWPENFTEVYGQQKVPVLGGFWEIKKGSDIPKKVLMENENYYTEPLDRQYFGIRLVRNYDMK